MIFNTLRSVINYGIDYKIELILISLRNDLKIKFEQSLTKLKKSIIVEASIILCFFVLLVLGKSLSLNPNFIEIFSCLLKALVVFSLTFRSFKFFKWVYTHQNELQKFINLWELSKNNLKHINSRFKRMGFLLIEAEYERRTGKWNVVLDVLTVLKITLEREFYYEKIYKELKIISKEIIAIHLFTIFYLLLVYICTRYILLSI